MTEWDEATAAWIRDLQSDGYVPGVTPIRPARGSRPQPPPKETGMKTTTVDKAKLLDTLKANRTKHKAEFEEARAEWRKQVALRLKAVLKEVEEQSHYENVFSPLSQLPKPKNFVDSYDTAIERLEWEVGAQIELDEREFVAYVLDKWDWRDQFVGTTSLYNATLPS